MSAEINDEWIYFIAQIGHEIRTPLNVVKGFGQLLEKEAVGPLNEKQKFYLNKMMDGTDDLLTIINQILDWARLSTGQMNIVRKDINLQHLSIELVGLFELAAQNKNITLSAMVEPNCFVFGDRDRLRQVLINLIDNAIKFTPMGGSIILQSEQRENHVALEVRDTGCGMSEEMLARVFEPFDTGTDKLERDGHGSGLGLWIARAIMEAHGGALSADSVAGQGSVFTMRFPAGEAKS